MAKSSYHIALHTSQRERERKERERERDREKRRIVKTFRIFVMLNFCVLFTVK